MRERERKKDSLKLQGKRQVDTGRDKERERERDIKRYASKDTK